MAETKTTPPMFHPTTPNSLSRRRSVVHATPASKAATSTSLKGNRGRRIKIKDENKPSPSILNFFSRSPLTKVDTKTTFEPTKVDNSINLVSRKRPAPPLQVARAAKKKNVGVSSNDENCVNGSTPQKRRSVGDGTASSPLILVEESDISVCGVNARGPFAIAATAARASSAPSKVSVSVTASASAAGEAKSCSGAAAQPSSARKITQMTLSKASTTKVRKTTSKMPPTIGLVRVKDSYTAPSAKESLRIDKKEIHDLFVGAVLGRNVAPAAATTKRKRRQPSQKLDLGITNDTNGVSRKHVEVTAINVTGDIPSVTFKVFNSVLNPICVATFITKKEETKIFRRSCFVHRGKSVTMKAGDVIEFDAYNHGTAGTDVSAQQVMPKHVFRVVTACEGRVSVGALRPINSGEASGAFRSSLAAASESATKKGKANESMEANGERKRLRGQGIKTRGNAGWEANPIREGGGLTPPTRTKLATLKTVKKPLPELEYAGMEGGCAEAASSLTLKPGDRLRILYDGEYTTEDLFGVKRTGWYFATATKIVSSKKGTDQLSLASFLVDVRFDDNSTATEIEYPSEVVQILTPTLEHNKPANMIDTHGVVYALSQNSTIAGSSPTIAYNGNPQYLCVGDLVDVRFQNGTSWYRGRVAALSDDKACCDVAYFDKQYERMIPFKEGHVRLIERGSHDCSWLDGLSVVVFVDSGRNTRRNQTTACKGKIIRIETTPKSHELATQFSSPLQEMDEFTRCTVKFGKSDREETTRPYTEIVKSLFTAVRTTCVSAHRSYHWPAPETDNLSTSRKRAVGKKNQQPPVANRLLSGADITTIQPIREGSLDPLPPATTTNVVFPLHETLHDSAEDDVNAALNCSQDSFFSPSESLGEHLSTNNLKEMHPSLSNSFWRALNSAEPHNGSELLTHMFAVHNAVPSGTLSENLFDLLEKGPKSEGTVFRDANRTELASRYAQILSSGSLRMEKSSLPAFGPSTFDDIKRCLAQPINEMQNVPTKHHSSSKTLSCSALRRSGQALQVASCGLGCLASLFNHQMKNIIDDNIDRARNRDLFACQPLVRAMLSCDGGIREALEVVVHWAAKCWFKHRHWINANEVTVGQRGRDSFENLSNRINRQFCATEAKRCLDFLGEITSYLIWLFCSEEGMTPQDCSLVIKDKFLSSIERDELDEAKRHGSSSSLSEGLPGKGFSSESLSEESLDDKTARLKLSFILSLYSELVGPVRCALAEHFGVLTEFDIITGGEF